ncbi:MAG: hypothetical protein ACPGIA_00190, partial [Luteolibacter sp.]
VAGTAKAEIEYSINGGYSNEYLWRGIQQGNDMVSTGLDIATEASGLSLSAGVWHADFNTGGNDTTETDVYFDISKDLGSLTASIGYIYYIYDDPAFSPNFQEYYLGLSTDVSGIDAYYGNLAGSNNNGYLELGLGKSFDLSDCLSLGVGTALGYAIESGDFANLVTTVSLDWAITDSATISPYVTYAVEGSEQEVYDNVSPQEFVGGIGVSVSF